jgi:hypothetical protein
MFIDVHTHIYMYRYACPLTPDPNIALFIQHLPLVAGMPEKILSEPDPRSLSSLQLLPVFSNPIVVMPPSPLHTGHLHNPI